MTTADAISAALWGFLVGFVGWSSCFRLPKPIADWLSPVQANATAVKGIVRMLVMLFLIFAILLALALLPLLRRASGILTTRE